MSFDVNEFGSYSLDSHKLDFVEEVPAQDAITSGFYVADIYGFTRKAFNFQNYNFGAGGDNAWVSIQNAQGVDIG
ncbi:hypothetical protein LXA43DRAFT_1105309 [Ganoderma leucocontextum]|nr:hypothetical protein LXA43DRAFT_1105309 [Ganoderma leucocontextum]